MLVGAKKKIPYTPHKKPRTKRRQPMMVARKAVQIRFAVNNHTAQPHPLQALYFGTANANKVREMAKGLELGGQRQPLHILPAGNAAGLPETILDGVTRIAAAQSIAWKDLTALMRYDLMDAAAAEIENIFFDFNTAQKHLPLLDQAAIFVRRFEISKGLPQGGLRHSAYEREAKAQLAKLTGKSGRHLARTFRILLLPRELLRKVRDGLLDQVAAEKVEALKVQVQIEIAERVATLNTKAEVTAVVTTYLQTIKCRQRSATELCEIWLHSLQRDLPLLEGRTDRVNKKVLHDNTATLIRAQKIISELLVAAAKYDGKSAEVLLKEMAKSLSA